MSRRFTLIDAPGLRCKNMRYSAAPHFDSPGADGAGLKVTQVRRRINAGEINLIQTLRSSPTICCREETAEMPRDGSQTRPQCRDYRLQRPLRRLCCSEGAPLGQLSARTSQRAGETVGPEAQIDWGCVSRAELTGSGLQLGDNTTAPS